MDEIKIRALTQEEGGGFLAEYINLKGCMADGETKFEALEELEKAKESWLLASVEFAMNEKVVYKRVNITFPEKLLNNLDVMLHNLHISRSAFLQQLVAKELKV